MFVDLVQTTTPDGMTLDGALTAPVDGVPPPTGFDAVICLHGAGSNFYGSLMSALAEPLAELGLAVLRANTRGHDGLCTVRMVTGGRRQGAAYEVVDECRYDVAGWIDLLAERGFRRVVLLGHSLGAIKAIYSQAHQPHDAVAAVVAVSPARLSYAVFRESPGGPQFLETLATARQHVATGNGPTLMDVRFPIPLVISAETYLEKYGPDERYNVLRFADRVGCPLLAVFGEEELKRGEAFAGLPEQLAALPDSGSRRDIQIVPAADHFYTDRQDALAAVVGAWLRGLSKD